jgi:hypothetical protein
MYTRKAHQPRAHPRRILCTLSDHIPGPLLTDDRCTVCVCCRCCARTRTHVNLERTSVFELEGPDSNPGKPRQRQPTVEWSGVL